MVQDIKEAELSELATANAGGALEGNDGDRSSSIAMSLDNKNNKKSKVYVAPPVEDVEVHEA